MNILILGAAGQISRMAADLLLRQTDANLILYARRATSRLKAADPQRVRLVDGDFTDTQTLTKTMQGVDVVYVNAAGDKAAKQVIAAAMQAAGVRKVIEASILGIYDEVPGAFGNWNKGMVGPSRIRQVAEATRVFENEAFDYTILRLTWLYNQAGNTAYMLTQKGEPFVGAQVTRQAVAQLLVDIITAADNRFAKTSLGVSEPNTDWDKPSFY
ncbi:NAD(P)H-binding protein [Hymenobacter perfusus]|uniref:NAD-dependent epimerase/dehydratase family protein n=1 Tax=Hymenobacter perfusus TaxID=1236770 RepID=A0A3R9MQS9_9BACT|nr:NAD(P)H-binding protein [Hymenobacter perfusus]RSK38398.1 NAD-dependent epimerase/dehydratase family protein [Hymenobacter perfusus]